MEVGDFLSPPEDLTPVPPPLAAPAPQPAPAPAPSPVAAAAAAPESQKRKAPGAREDSFSFRPSCHLLAACGQALGSGASGNEKCGARLSARADAFLLSSAEPASEPEKAPEPAPPKAPAALPAASPAPEPAPAAAAKSPAPAPAAAAKHASPGEPAEKKAKVGAAGTPAPVQTPAAAGGAESAAEAQGAGAATTPGSAWGGQSGASRAFTAALAATTKPGAARPSPGAGAAAASPQAGARRPLPLPAPSALRLSTAACPTQLASPPRRPVQARGDALPRPPRRRPHAALHAETAQGGGPGASLSPHDTYVFAGGGRAVAHGRRAGARSRPPRPPQGPHGAIAEGDLWLPQLKTHCVVIYETEEMARRPTPARRLLSPGAAAPPPRLPRRLADPALPARMGAPQAAAAREALDGLQWPAKYGKILAPRFITEEEARTFMSGGVPSCAPRAPPNTRGCGLEEGGVCVSWGISGC